MVKAKFPSASWAGVFYSNSLLPVAWPITAILRSHAHPQNFRVINCSEIPLMCVTEVQKNIIW